MKAEITPSKYKERAALWAILTDSRTVEETEKTAFSVMNGNEFLGWARDMENGAFRGMYAVFPQNQDEPQGALGLLTTLDEKSRPSTTVAWRVEYEAELKNDCSLSDVTSELASMVYDGLGIKTVNYPETILFVDDLANETIIVYLTFGNCNQFASSLKGKELVPLESVVLKA